MRPDLKEYWCIPPEHDSEFVAKMEDVLEVYHRPYNPARPVVCMDETNRQLFKQVRPLRPMKPGEPEKEDYEYERNGVADIFLFVEPLAGRRRATVTERRTAVDWAHRVKEMLDLDYPDAERVVLVMDNLNTHGTWSLYDAFPAQEARRLAERLDIHYTPKHGSWLNIAEIELSALSKQCLSRRIPDLASMSQEVRAWASERNTRQTKVDWHFTTEDARIKLKRLYPVF